VRGFVYLQRHDPAAAEADARAVLAVVAPHDASEAAQVGPHVLLAMARQAVGDGATALTLLADAAAAADRSALLFPRRQAVACYAACLLQAGRAEEALAWARRATSAPGEDVRSRVYVGRVLAAALASAGLGEEATRVAERAVRDAYATQQTSERADAEAVRAALP
jgi:tetratricopeptide (TPR) repeat protein